MVIHTDAEGNKTTYTWAEWKALEKAQEAAKQAEQAKAWAARKAEEEACTTCQEYKKIGFGPSHFASSSCRSGGHNHCTCDTCF